MEVNFLPKIDWDPDYIAAIAAHPTGKVDYDDPAHPEYRDQSAQSNCILYINKVNPARRSGSVNRTSFMYTLDRLGYRDHYDVYDVQGFGNTNNDLGGRASVSQAIGYSLIIHDVGRLPTRTIPKGLGPGPQFRYDQKVEQTNWYRTWLQRTDPGTRSLWVIGENWVQDVADDLLLSGAFMGVTLMKTDIGSSIPDVVGAGAFTWSGGAQTNFLTDKFSLSRLCPETREYDGLGVSSGTVVHQYKVGGIPREGATVLHQSGNPSVRWNTIAMSFNWFDVNEAAGGQPARAATHLASEILGGVLPLGCVRAEQQTDSGEDTEAIKATVLYQNEPNPFNPLTTIRFDLARAVEVELKIFDVSGRLVKTLVDGPLLRDRHAITWNGLDNSGQRVSSGVYIYRLLAGDFTATRKLVVLK